MPSTHAPNLSSLHAPARSAVGFGQERPPGRSSGGCNSGFTPRSRMQLLVRFGGPVGPPPPSTVFVVVLPSRMEIRREREGGPTTSRWAGLRKTVTFRAISVTFWPRGVSARRRNGKTPRGDGVPAGRSRLYRPVCRPVTISLCDANHPYPPANGGSTSIVCPVRSVVAAVSRTATPSHRYEHRANTAASRGFRSPRLARQVGDAVAERARSLSRTRRPRPHGRLRSSAP